MKPVRLMLELRFSVVSLLFMSRGHEMAAAMSAEFPDFQTNGLNVQFDLGGGSSIGLDPTKIGLTLMGDRVTLHEATRLSARCMKEWATHVKSALSFSRVGVRVQAVKGSEMTPQELTDVCASFIFADPFREVAPPGSDFAVTIEDLDGNDGMRTILGVMAFSELAQKWSLPEDGLEEADSFFVVDTDIGDSMVGMHELEAYIRRAWARIHDQNVVLAKKLGL